MGCDIKVSVVIIAKNAEKTMAKCLSSIVEQTYPPHEIIVVDGRSTDGTRDVASRFPVKLVVAPKKDTYGTSRTLGVKKATGDIIAFLDADDYAEKAWLKNLMKAFRDENVWVTNPSRVYVYPHNWFTELKWEKLRKKPLLARRKVISKDSWLAFMISGSALRKELIERVKYFDEDMFFGAEDKDLILRVVSEGYRISHVPEAVIYFKPSSSAKEWVKEAFLHHGLGHGAMRRKFGKFRLPLKIPLLTGTLSFALLTLSILRLWLPLLILLFATIVGIAVEAYRLYRITKRFSSALKYIMVFIIGRNLEFLGFVIGYLVPTRVLRKVVMR